MLCWKIEWCMMTIMFNSSFLKYVCLRRETSKNYDVIEKPFEQPNSPFGILVHYVDFHKIYALCLYPAISGGDLRDNCVGK